MRVEYVIVGFVLALAVLLISLALLSGVVPGMDLIFNNPLVKR